MCAALLGSAMGRHAFADDCSIRRGGYERLLVGRRSVERGAFHLVIIIMGHACSSLTVPLGVVFFVSLFAGCCFIWVCNEVSRLCRRLQALCVEARRGGDAV